MSYRDDEVGPTHPLRRVLSKLPPAQRTHLAVPRLSPAAVDTLARQAGLQAPALAEIEAAASTTRPAGRLRPRRAQRGADL